MKIEYIKKINGEEKKFNLLVKNRDAFFEIKCLSNDNKEMGFVTFEIFNDYVWIYKIETKKAFQHQGVASAVIDVMEYFAMMNYKNRIEAKFYPSNQYARAFYEKHDYFVPNKTKTWEDYDETWRMHKDLDFQKIKSQVAPNLIFSDEKQTEEKVLS